MTSRWLGCVLCVMLGVLPAAAEGIPVGGRVLVPGGGPLAEAEVALLPLLDALSGAAEQLAGRESEPAALARTDEDGRFTLAAPRAGLWRLRIRAAGFVDLEAALTPLLEATELPDATLAGDTGLSVRVIDAAGRPVQGAAVVVEREGKGFDFDRPLWTTVARRAVTGEDGTARLPRGERERVSAAAWAPDRPYQERSGVTGTATTLRLGAAAPRTLELRDAAGNPVPRATVRVGRIAAGHTDEAGRFKLAAGPADETDLAFLASDGRRLETRLRTRGAAEGQPELLTLPDRLAVPGRLIDAESRKPVPGGIVWDQENPVDAAVADGSGGFVLAGPAGRRMRVTAGAPGYLPSGMRDFQLADDGRPGPTLALRPGAFVEGTTVDEDDAPVSGAEIRVEEKRTPGTMRIEIGGPRREMLALSGASGRYRIGPLDPDKNWTVKARATGRAPAERAVADLEPYRTRAGVNLTLGRGYVVTGRVVDAEGGGVSDAGVTIETAAEGGRVGMMMVMSGGTPQAFEGTTDTEGRFEVRGLPAARFDVAVRRVGFAAHRTKAVEVGGDELAFDLGEIVMRPGERVQGIVMDTDGAPIEGVEVYAREKGAPTMVMVMPGAAAPDRQPDALTDPGGWFEVADLDPAQSYGLSFNRRGYVDGSVAAVELPRPEPIEVRLDAASDVIGHVRDPEGEPIAGAEVRLSRSRTIEMGGSVMQTMMMNSTSSDAEGRFVFEDQEPGTISLAAVASGWREAKLQGLEIPKGKDLTGVVLPLEPGAVVEGRVFTPDGRPAVGATVNPVSDQPQHMARFSGTPTDGNGYFRLEGLTPGPVSVEANHRDYPRAVKDLDVKEGINAVELHFAGGQEVTGRVSDTGGRPVGGAAVRLAREGEFFWGPETTSRADGSFVMPGVQDGEYRAFVDAEGYASSRGDTRVSVAGEPVAGVDLRLDPGGVIAGRVLGVAPTDLSKVSVQARGEAFFGEGGAQPDSSGAYRLEHLAPGPYTVVASVAGTGRQARERVTLESGVPEVTLDLQFGGGLTLSGRAVQGDAPVAGAMIYAQGVDVDHSGWNETSSEGEFSIEGLEPGTYRVQLQHWRTGLTYREEVELTASREIELRVPTAVVRGVVRDASDRQPLGGVKVTLERADGESSGWQPTRTGTTDLEGRFILDNVGDGPWRVTASKQGYAAVSQPVDVQFERDVEDLKLEMDPTEGLTLVALLPTGGIPDELQVAVLDRGGALLTGGSFATGEGGRVRLSSVPPGTWELVVTAGGAAVSSFSAQAPGPPIEVRLEAPCALSVRVPELLGGAVVARATVTDASGRPFRILDWHGAPRGEFRVTDGRLEMRSLPAGSWTVRVTAADGRAWESGANTSPGATTEVTME